MVFATALLVCGCNKKQPATEPAADIRGAPINARAAPAAPLVNTNASVPAPQQSDYLAVGFDKLSGYQIEISDELLGPD